MFNFLSQDPQHEIAHPSLAEAAGSEFFTVRFRPQGDGYGHFSTESTAIAKALDNLIEDDKVRGVKLLGNPDLAGTVPIAFEDLAAKIAELTQPADGEGPLKLPTLSQLAETFSLDETVFRASLAKLAEATPEAAEALKAAGIVFTAPEEVRHAPAPRRGQRG